MGWAESAEGRAGSDRTLTQLPTLSHHNSDLQRPSSETTAIFQLPALQQMVRLLSSSTLGAAEAAAGLLLCSCSGPHPARQVATCTTCRSCFYESFATAILCGAYCTNHSLLRSVPDQDSSSMGRGWRYAQRSALRCVWAKPDPETTQGAASEPCAHLFGLLATNESIDVTACKMSWVISWCHYREHLIRQVMAIILLNTRFGTSIVIVPGDPPVLMSQGR